MRLSFLLAVIAAALQLSCSSGGDNGGELVAGFCSTVSGGGTNTSSIATSCNGCSIENRNNSIDANLSTAAVMRIGAGSTGELALRANAQSGIVYPAGTKVGFVISGSDDETLPFVRTILNGTDQEESKLSQTVETQGSQSFIFFTASAQFNAIEAVLPGDGALVGVSDRSISVFEFCAR